MTLAPGGGGGNTIPPSSGAGSIAEITSDDDSVTITDPEGPVTDLSVAGGGGVASLSGAGVTESPGILNQAGGMTITDTEGDGFSVETNENILFDGAVMNVGTTGGLYIEDSTGISILEDSLRGEIQISAYANLGSVVIASAAISGALGVIPPSNSIALPLTVVEGVNDTFTFTTDAVATVYTVPPGIYATTADVVAAVNNATPNTFPWSVSGEQGLYPGIFFGTPLVGDEISFGPTDVASDLGFVDNPDVAVAAGDSLSFFTAFAGPGGVQQQTITGALSTVVDPAAKAVLTSLLAALSATVGYGLVLDGTT